MSGLQDPSIIPGWTKSRPDSFFYALYEGFVLYSFEIREVEECSNCIDNEYQICQIDEFKYKILHLGRKKQDIHFETLNKLKWESI